MKRSHKYKFSVFCFGLLISSGAYLPVQSAGSDKSEHMLIVDGSGSMWGKIDGKYKITIMRQALQHSLVSHDSRFKLGLTAYGHRRKGDCRDVQILQKPTQLNGLEMSAIINKLSPRGKTPLSTALEKVADRFADKQAQNSIILLTDGPENCRREVCDTVSTLKRDQPDLAIHVVTLGMTHSDQQKVRCIADLSGGRFRASKNQGDLQLALSQVFKDLNKRPKGAQKSQEVRESSPKLSLSLHLGPNSPVMEGEIRWVVTPLTPLKPAIYNEAKRSEIKSNHSIKNEFSSILKPVNLDEARPTIELPPGRYRVEVQFEEFTQSDFVTLKKGEQALKKIVLNLTRIKLPAIWATANSHSGFGLLVLEKTGKDEENNKTLFIRLQERAKQKLIPAGAYKISALDNGEIHIWHIFAEPGGELSLPLWQGLGRISFNLQDKHTKQKLNRPLLQLYTTSSKGVKKTWQEVARSSADNPVFDLNAGSYRAKLSEDYAVLWHDFEITKGQSLTQTLYLNKADISIMPHHENGSEATNQKTKSNQSLNYGVMELYQVHDEERLKFLGQLYPGTHSLTPGFYQLKYVLHQSGLAIKEDFSVKSGEKLDLKINTQTNLIDFQINEQMDLIAQHNIHWQLRNDKKELIWQSGLVTPKIALFAGKYDISAMIGNKRYQKNFTVKHNDKPLETSRFTISLDRK